MNNLPEGSVRDEDVSIYRAGSRFCCYCPRRISANKIMCLACAERGALAMKGEAFDGMPQGDGNRRTLPKPRAE